MPTTVQFTSYLLPCPRRGAHTVNLEAIERLLFSICHVEVEFLKHIIASLTITLALIATIAFSVPVSAAGVNGNPWGYSFVASNGRLIYAPNPAFCGQYFHCIPNFPNGKGYVVECRDMMFSKSGGIAGSCSRHKGNWQTLYAHESSGAKSSPAQPVSSGSSPNMAPSLPLTGSDPYAASAH